MFLMLFSCRDYSLIMDAKMTLQNLDFPHCPSRVIIQLAGNLYFKEN